MKLIIGVLIGAALSAFTTWALTRNTNAYTRGFRHGYTHAHLERDNQARKE